MTDDEGTNLAKVLWYYNLLPNVIALSQKIVCPFHEDINPSLIVNLENGSWYCFGCNLSGDAQRFVMLMENTRRKTNDLNAYRKYLKILRSKTCSKIKVAKNEKRYKATGRELYAEAYDYYHGLRTEDWSTSQTQEVVKARRYMKERGFTPKALCACKAKVTYNTSYGIIFPMLDNGKFKGWVCRTMVPAVERKRKYLYNSGFSRATTLVGTYGKKDYVFVVEGYMDRLKFVQFGETNVVAILGWKMSQQQIEKLKQKGITKIISALDNDVCGKRGTDYLKNFFDVTRFRYLKGIKDPGDMTEELFNKMLDKTMQSFEKGK